MNKLSGEIALPASATLAESILYYGMMQHREVTLVGTGGIAVPNGVIDFAASVGYKLQVSDNEVRINSDIETTGTGYIYIKENKRVCKIYLNDILYLESMKEYVKIHTTQKQFITKNSIGQFESKLPENNFVRVHRSFIVSISKILSFNSTSIELFNTNIPISRTYKASALAALNYAGEI